MPGKPPKANNLPKAGNVTATGFEDDLIAVTLSGKDKDGTVTGYTLNSLPTNGTLYLDAAHTQVARIGTAYSTNTFYFVPSPNFNGSALLNFAVTDDQGGVSSPGVATINVAAVNDGPLLDLNGSASGTSATLNYAVGSTATLISPSATVSDIDSSNFDKGQLKISITNKTASDQLNIATDSIVTFKNSAVLANGVDVFVNRVKVGTISSDGTNGSDLVIDLASGATPASIVTLLNHISYSNSSTNPSPSPRTVQFTLVDGDGTVNGGTDTGIATATINLIGPNHAPTGTVTISGTATEDQTLTA
jgi:hypothetical protein